MATLRSCKQVGGSDGGGGGSGGEVEGRDRGAVQAADIKEKKNARTSKVVFGSLILDLLGFMVVLPLSPALLDYYSKHDSSGLYSSLLSSVTYYQHIISVPARFHSVLFGGMALSVLLECSSALGTFLCVLECLGTSEGALGAAAAPSASVSALGTPRISVAVPGDVSGVSAASQGHLDMRLHAPGELLDVSAASHVSLSVSKRLMHPDDAHASWDVSDRPCSVSKHLTCLPRAPVAPEMSHVSQSTLMMSHASLMSSGHRDDRPHASLDTSLMTSPCVSCVLSVSDHIRLSHVPLMSRDVPSVSSALSVPKASHGRLMCPGVSWDASCESLPEGLMMMIPAFILIGASETNLGLYSGLMLYAIGSSMMVPCLTALASCHGAASHKGTLLNLRRIINTKVDSNPLDY
ncbi:hypothetical protein O3P69_005408 [Scylla paramamosain]|uniref:Uncharacterized protein n=1 Tax=Scylla paramamosain TaxID=85552 RepID=A0AAW0U8D0_SCYPA